MKRTFTKSLLLGGALFLLLPIGCGRESSFDNDAVPPAPVRPLRAMQSAIRRGQWQQANQYTEQVLQQHPDNADAIADVARVAYETGDSVRATELLTLACRTESFAKAGRVQQTMIAMIAEGRFHEGLAFLEDAVAAQPEQIENRRWLYDFYVGSEDRGAGLNHGRTLVLQRAIDVDLLMTLSNTERRTQDSQPLIEMTNRNPDDKRPLLGAAKSKFDSGNYAECIEQLREIVSAHADYEPAQALLGRALATDSRFEEFERWMESQSPEIQRNPYYWVALGDWLRNDNRTVEAARAYWEATQRDPDWMEPWSKLGSTLQLLPDVNGERAGLNSENIAAINRRSQLLSQFNLLKTRFERTGKISRATVVEMVKVLGELGRLWEGEAWAQIASGLPEDDSVDVESVRRSIVSQLSKQTPWQITDALPEFQFNLRNVKWNKIHGLEGNQDNGENQIKTARSQSEERVIDGAKHLALVNEAMDRGLDFAGRTGERLNEPGIMLFQTLGCGGGTIDFDRDGWSDLYLIAAGGTPPAKDSDDNALIRNLQGTFHDVTSFASAGDRGFGQGVAVGDVNEDGFADLLVLNYGPNVLMLNNGDGTFQDRSDLLADNGEQWSTSAAIADINQDQIADVVIVNYCAGLGPVTEDCPSAETGLTQSCTPMKFDAEPDQFLMGTAEGNFINQTKSWQANPSVPGRGLGIVAGSFDGKPGIEILIANDMTNNHYWGQVAEPSDFVLGESAMLRGLATDDRALAQGSMGIATGDFDQDGELDFYVTNFDREYNTYHGQRAQGIWQDETNRLKLAGPTLPLVAFGTVAVDLDRDTNLELLVTNGHVDIFSRDQTRSIYAQPMQLFQRNAENAYDSIADLLDGEYLSTPHVGRALWTIDVNRDAQVDLAITHQTEPVALLINHSQPRGRWLEVTLTATDDSRDAIGSIVEVTVDQQTWVAAAVSGDGYLCSDERVLRFGLGEAPADASVSLRVTWQNGVQQQFPSLGIDTSYLVIQGEDRPFVTVH